MIAIELFEDGDHSKPDAKLTAGIVARARDKGLILLSCGPYYNVLRILVPLTIEDAQIRQGLEIINQCFAEAKQVATAPCRRRRCASCPAYGDPGRIRRLRRIRQSVREQE
ncbi:aminotransferase class III-fold pyridoxal phosphate-dependent enzyme [Escherichia coli]|uniref:aminotransferase class III-fold pyridoxal phosphate-dependent enzyme n=1 Tax=Escherichia coli TaxID=562 RepID=UPI0020237D89|nr:aminotransferase class III-fold pyridoxal phosphate-dependent enzyme [Escherichia coli]